MRITVDHLTVYRYDVPVVLEPHVFRLRPRTNGAQRVVSFDLQITPTPAAQGTVAVGRNTGHLYRRLRAAGLSRRQLPAGIRR